MEHSAIVSAYQYQNDANGNRTQQLETNGGAAEITTYTFDGNDRLTKVAYPAKTTDYSYDAGYNRLTERSLDNAGQALLDDKSYHYNSRNQLTGITFVGREAGSGTRKAVEEMFQECGLKVAPSIELSSNEAIKHGVLAGLGIAVLSQPSVRLELAAGELVVLDVQGFPLRRRWYALHRKGKRLSRAAQTFLEYLQEEGEEEVSEMLGVGRGRSKYRL